MISEKFRSIMQSNKGCAVVMAGSDSDKNYIEEIIKSLQKYEILFDVRILSAHKQPSQLEEAIREYNDINGSAAYVAIAGGVDALSGTLSYHAFGPVISCPPDGLENRTCLLNPIGSSNATIYRAANIGRFIAQIYSRVNPRFKEILEKEIRDKIKSLRTQDANFQIGYGSD
ncbi:AIR carboxylase family protein [Candidatus Woesearchaeota archaeon]|nr:AIR carboxylase family protein [Candidatus Woesearchaeota archaeon]